MISVESMIGIEKSARQMGIDDSILMENAGANAAGIANEMLGLAGKRVLVLCGTGNNGGDGLVFARHALILGAKVSVYLMRDEVHLKPLAKRNFGILKNLGGRRHDIVFCREITPGTRADIVIDAMLGTGIRGEVSEDYAKVIRLFNGMTGHKISLDCPSGIDADTGESLGTAAKPDITITFHDKKKGMSKSSCGQVLVAGIGIPKM